MPALDTDPAIQHQAARAIDPLHRALLDAFVAGSDVIRALGGAQHSTRASRARAHLIETLVALDESLSGHDHAQVSLRRGRG